MPWKTPKYNMRRGDRLESHPDPNNPRRRKERRESTLYALIPWAALAFVVILFLL